MAQFEAILATLKAAGETEKTIYEGVSEEQVVALEKQLGYSLPLSYKQFLQTCNGFRLGFTKALFGIHENESLDIYANYRWETKESSQPLKKHLLPVAPNGLGDYYCLDLKTVSPSGKESKVVFWQHDNFRSKSFPVFAENFQTFITRFLQEL